MFEIFWKSKQL